ncbi:MULTISPECIES: Hsp20/alpha crystallin family protein [unclassified Rhodococcus (in: high G+C Gram-positive bacteria)]|uniref:Hsp20/alpha crystallin family protein n=1 Tax=unclassified Rhodococcus (in: high G+C Gram-positive bacteria) TaxID=192944 RepID=UPI00163A4AD5|nr:MULTISPECIES: Hsp20/alpha crystallin family protein [unclassified Rhodococcus (in: high G+C Gram-positive bacteria)]MBC2644331.1 Hsp20/alpha crystallin family protein [Rhodococcus sp. 3A]MBC2897976.1 Hsp20/alpha crystallin family protein [Rhodococcus sp. 4CII]
MVAPAQRSGHESGRWGPLAELADIEHRISPLRNSVPAAPFGDRPPWRPLADVSETEDGYLVEVEVEVPGVTREDLAITLSANELEISGKFVEKKKLGWLRTRSRTRRTGSVEFRTLLARDVDADNITAALADGVLTVTLPTTAAARSRRIQVTTD